MLVLASASPRRRELLTQAGYSFEVHPADIPEDPLPNEDPIAYVTRLAREKAEAVFAELSYKTPGAPGPSHLGTWETTNPRSAPNPALYQGTTSVVPQTHQNEVRALAPEGVLSETLTVLAADTTVTLDNQILGKPSDPADAARMLRLLSGRTHNVITGVALLTATSTQVASETTAVTFIALSEKDIAAYVATGEPMDKAGAYAIQGRAARWIPRIEGDYFNVVGLPIALVSALLDSL
jgi:septum formation protein